MATTNNDDSPPHGKTRLIQKYTAIDFGPLNTYRESHISNFRGGSYRLTTPIAGGGVMLYRLYGGTAGEVGHYWTVESREGNVGFQLDFAMIPQWGGTLSETTEVYVPEGIILYEGYVGPQRGEVGYTDFGGGGWQVLIPYPVVDSLIKAQYAIKEGKERSEAEKHYDEAMNNQCSILEKYENEAVKYGKETIKQTQTVKKALRSLKSANSPQKMMDNAQSALQSQSSSSGSDGSATKQD